MRSLLLVSLFACFTASAIAGCENSTLVVRANSGANIKVYIDGETGQNPATPAVTVRELTPGSHMLKVVAVYTDEYGQRQRHKIYNGSIEVHSSMYMDAHVEDHKGVSIHETRQACGGQPSDGAGQNSNGTGNGYSSAPSNTAPPVNTDQQNTNSSYQPPVQNTYSSNIPAHMSDVDFYQLRSAIEATQYEVKKMDTLKILVNNKQFVTSQVASLMSEFTFESNKLAVAKLLYDHTVDKQNYNTLASHFNFDARKEDFKKFMAGK